MLEEPVKDVVVRQTIANSGMVAVDLLKSNIAASIINFRHKTVHSAIKIAFFGTHIHMDWYGLIIAASPSKNALRVIADDDSGFEEGGVVFNYFECGACALAKAHNINAIRIGLSVGDDLIDKGFISGDVAE